MTFTTGYDPVNGLWWFKSSSHFPRPPLSYDYVHFQIQTSVGLSVSKNLHILLLKFSQPWVLLGLPFSWLLLCLALSSKSMFWSLKRNSNFGRYQLSCIFVRDNIILLLHGRCFVFWMSHFVLQAMTMMGLYDTAYWLSWFTWEGFITLISSLLIVLFGMMFQFEFFLNNSFAVVFLLFFLFQLNMVRLHHSI